MLTQQTTKPSQREERSKARKSKHEKAPTREPLGLGLTLGHRRTEGLVCSLSCDRREPRCALLTPVQFRLGSPPLAAPPEAPEHPMLYHAVDSWLQFGPWAPRGTLHGGFVGLLMVFIG